MTAQLIDSMVSSPARPVRSARRGKGTRRVVTLSALAGGNAPAWAPVERQTSGCSHVAPVIPIAAGGSLGGAAQSREAVRSSGSEVARYEWTDRGLAVLLALVALVVMVMSGTLVGGFLAISDAPLPSVTNGAVSQVVSGIDR